MFKFIGKSLAGLVLTKDAQSAVVRIASPKARDNAKPAAATPRNQVVAQTQAQAKGLVTEQRAELIRQAMQVRAAKQKILSNLDDETRGKLVAAAMKALLNEGQTKE